MNCFFFFFFGGGGGGDGNLEARVDNESRIDNMDVAQRLALE